MSEKSRFDPIAEFRKRIDEVILLAIASAGNKGSRYPTSSTARFWTLSRDSPSAASSNGSIKDKARRSSGSETLIPRSQFDPCPAHRTSRRYLNPARLFAHEHARCAGGARRCSFGAGCANQPSVGVAGLLGLDRLTSSLSIRLAHSPQTACTPETGRMLGSDLPGPVSTCGLFFES